MPSTLIDIQDLRKVYPSPSRGGDDLTAVDGVSLTVDAGEAVGLVGESGSGKSTTARIIVGLEVATSGSVQVCGNDWSARTIKTGERRKRARLVQMVFQDPYLSLDRRQSIGDGLREILNLHFDLDRHEREQRVSALLEQVGLPAHKADVRPVALSGGERQRVAIARALAPEPRLVVLDEAVAALDVSIQAQILNLLNDIRSDSGVAYLLITHDLAVVSQVTDRTLVMCNGQIVEEGATRQIIQDPQHPYTRRLLASVPRPGWTPRRAATSAAV